jgi:hypothetical protein
MSDRIDKIQKLNNVESFLQVNFVKGYKYVDKAGEIVNYFHKGNIPPKFRMGLNGLEIFNLEDKIDTIKISSSNFWAHFLVSDSFEQIDDFFGPKVQDVIKILEVEKISRIGWRNYFVYDFKNDVERDEALKKFNPLERILLEAVVFSSKCSELDANITLRKVKNEINNLPGILIDADFYQKYDDPIKSDKIASKLLDFKTVIRSDDFLNLVNEILAK